MPRVLAFGGTWLVQEDLDGWRLSQALADATEADGEAWLDAALPSLPDVHRAICRNRHRTAHPTTIS